MGPVRQVGQILHKQLGLVGVGLSKKPKVWSNLESGCGWMLDYNVSSGPIGNGLRFESLFYQL